MTIINIPPGVSRTQLDEDLSAEASARASADATLQANVDKKVSKAGDTMTGALTCNAGATVKGTLTVGTSSANGAIEIIHSTPFIDFHHARSTADYTARIINGNGTLVSNVSTDDGVATMSMTLSANDMALTLSNPTPDDATGMQVVTADWANSKLVHISDAETITGQKKFTSPTLLYCAEMYGATPYIDFHWNNAAVDWTSRLINVADGVLEIKARDVDNTHTTTLRFDSTAQLTTLNSVMEVNGSNYYFKKKESHNAAAVPDADKYCNMFALKGADNQNMAYLRVFQNSGTPRRFLQIQVNSYTEGETMTRESAYFQLFPKYVLNGVTYNPYASVPYRAYAERDNYDILCHGSIPGDTRILHTTGNEYSSGVKTFGTSPAIKHGSRLLGESGDLAIMGINFYDGTPLTQSQVRIATVESTIGADGRNMLTLALRSTDNTTWHRIQMITRTDGLTWAEAPTPPSTAAGTQIATASWVRARISEFPTVIDGTIGGTVISADLSDVTFHTANRLLEVHISARRTTTTGSAMYGQFTIPLAPEGHIGMASPYFDVPAGHGCCFQIFYSDSSTEDNAIFEIAVISSTGGDITDECDIAPYFIAL